MAGITQALHIRVIVSTAFSQRNDVIALRGLRHPALQLARDTQGMGGEQLPSHFLKTTTGNPLGCIRLLSPRFALMVSAPPTSNRQRAAPGH